MERSTKSGEVSPLSDSFALDRHTSLQEARATLEELFTRGTVVQRVSEAHAKLRKWSWSYNRVDEMFRGKAARIEAHEMDHIRALKKAREIAEAKDEFSQLRARIARLETALAVADEEFHQPHVEALRGAVSGLGGVVGRPGATGERR